jgi:hypothetical protein
MKKSVKTTIAGVCAGLGIILHMFSGLFAEGGPGFSGLFDAENVTQLVAGLGAMGIGLFARDDDVSSEGGTASKDTPA